MSRVEWLCASDGRTVVLVGGILGLASDESIVTQAFGRANPSKVLLGIPFEDLDAVRATAGQQGTTEFEAEELDEVYLERLAGFGEVRSPPPDLYALFRLAAERGVPVEAIDLGDEDYTEAYTKNVGMWEVLRSNRRQRALPEKEIEASSAEEFAERWDAALYPSKGLRKLQDLRAETMAKKIVDSAKPGVRVLALVSLPRKDAVSGRIQAAGFRP